MFIKYTKQSYEKDSMEIYLYGILKTLENQVGFTMVSIKQLLEFTDLGRSATHKIEQALTSLIDQEIIDVYDAIDLQNKVDIRKVKPSDSLYIRVIETVVEGKAFIQIFTAEILKFMSTKMKGTKVDIFKQFLYLMKFVNQGKQYRKISFPTIEKIAKDTCISNRSVRNYTTALKEHGFLYSNTLIIEKEKIKNVYSRPEHAQDVDDAIAEAIAKGTKEINNQKGFRKESNTAESHIDKEFKSTVKKPELMLEIDKQIRDTFAKYRGELNDQSSRKLIQFQELHGVEVLLKGLHISMAGKEGLKNPTGFMLKQLEDGKVIEEAKYQIKRNKENLERMNREDTTLRYDYVAALREKKEREREEGKQNKKVICDPNNLLNDLLIEKKSPQEEWMKVLGV